MEEDEEVDEEDFDEEEEQEEEKPKKLLKKKKENSDNSDRYVAVHQPEVIGMMDKTNNKVQTDIWQVLTDIRNGIERIEQSV